MIRKFSLVPISLRTHNKLYLYKVSMGYLYFYGWFDNEVLYMKFMFNWHWGLSFLFYLWQSIVEIFYIIFSVVLHRKSQYIILFMSQYDSFILLLCLWLSFFVGKRKFGIWEFCYIEQILSRNLFKVLFVWGRKHVTQNSGF